jgi:thioredoxin 2
MPGDQAVVCVKCGAVNRVPAERPALKAHCGSCHEPLFSGHPADIDSAMLERQISQGSVPVVVDVWAAWCGPCRRMAPEYEKVAAEIEPRARLVKLNSDNEQALSARLGIRGIPTMILFVEGRERDRVAGAMSADQIKAWLEPRLGQP